MLENKYIWSWEAKEKQINECSKIGDIVDVGYISDCNKYNYKTAIISKINKINNKINFYQIWIKFDDEYEMVW